MKPKLVMISHGFYSQQLVESAKMILGEIKDLYTIPMLESDGLDGTKQKLQEVLREIGDVPTIIAVDLLSGTPCNVAVEAMYSSDKIRVLAGMNLPMAMEFALSEIEDMLESLKVTGVEAICIVEKPDVDLEMEEYEE